MKESRICKDQEVKYDTRPLAAADIDMFSWSGGERHLEYLTEWVEKSKNGETVVLGLFEDGEPIGLGYVDFTSVSDAGTLWALNIKEEKRSQGLGTGFMRDFEKVIENRGLTFIELRVEEDNLRAIELYQKLGYKKRASSLESWEQDDGHGGVEIYEAKCFIFRKRIGLN